MHELEDEFEVVVNSKTFTRLQKQQRSRRRRLNRIRGSGYAFDLDHKLDTKIHVDKMSYNTIHFLKRKNLARFEYQGVWALVEHRTALLYMSLREVPGRHLRYLYRPR